MFGDERIVALMSCKGDFKIRSKKDAQAFFDMKKEGAVHATNGEYYWHDGEMDYYLAVKENYRKVFQRFMSERGNIFSPYWEVLDPVETIWKTRKYINAKWFSNE